MNKEQKPIIYTEARWLKARKTLSSQVKHLQLIDTLDNQLHELYQMRNPALRPVTASVFANFRTRLQKELEGGEISNWVYLPWKATAVRLLIKPLFQEVRTGRNRPFISELEQQRLLDLKIGVIGLSVGNAVVQTLSYTGAANYLKLADADLLELSNLNRLQSTIDMLGKKKTTHSAQAVYEVNPYATVKQYHEGVNADNLHDFLLGNNPLDLVIDECDDLTLKTYLRLGCRSLGIPLLSVTDVGFESKVDFLRFDLSKHAGGFKDAPDLSFEEVIEAYGMSEKVDLAPKEQLKLIAEIVGAKNVSVEMQAGSILRAEGKLAGWPQLAMTAFMGGSLASYTALLFATEAKTYVNQRSFSLRELLSPGYNSRRERLKREKKTTKFLSYLKKIR